MRYRKGSKVEILSEKEIPSGSWRCGEIVCKNGHDYTVIYTNDASLKRVSEKAIRPCPPRSEVSECWLPGDVVEVLYDFSWRMATISLVCGQGYFVVRLLGSYVELKVSKFEIRTRQSWEDNKWVVIGKSSGQRVQMMRPRIDVHVKDKVFLMDNAEFQPKNTAAFRTLKRRGCGYLQDETIGGTAKRFRETENNGMVHRVIAADDSPLTERINGVAFSRERMIEESTYSSFQNQIGFSEMQAERWSIGGNRCSFATDFEADAAESISCSVGSCSITNNSPRKLYYHANLNEDIDDCSSDAESFSQRECEEGNSAFFTKEDLATEIHRLELHAYRSTIEALHASGPLSWDQEALMTDLRLSLHISNDEHLMEVRNLVSASNSIRSR